MVFYLKRLKSVNINWFNNNFTVEHTYLFRTKRSFLTVKIHCVTFTLVVLWNKFIPYQEIDSNNVEQMFSMFPFIPFHMLIGLSATPLRAKGFALVRSCVRHAISRKPRIRFWWFFAQSCILIKLKKCSKRIFEKNSRFRDFGQKWPIFAIFGHF